MVESQRNSRRTSGNKKNIIWFDTILIFLIGCTAERLSLRVIDTARNIFSTVKMFYRLRISSSMCSQLYKLRETQICSRLHQILPQHSRALLQDLVTLFALNGYIDNPNPLVPVVHRVELAQVHLLACGRGRAPLWATRVPLYHRFLDKFPVRK